MTEYCLHVYVSGSAGMQVGHVMCGILKNIVLTAPFNSSFSQYFFVFDIYRISVFHTGLSEWVPRISSPEEHVETPHQSPLLKSVSLTHRGGILSVPEPWGENACPEHEWLHLSRTVRYFGQNWLEVRTYQEEVRTVVVFYANNNLRKHPHCVGLRS